MDSSPIAMEQQQDAAAVPAAPVAFAAEPPAVIPSQSPSCPACAAAAAAAPGMRAASGAAAYVYAIGSIEARFPKLSVEKEFAQAVGREKTEGLSDPQVLKAVLSQPGNRYLARQLCWVMTIEGLETYILVPRDPADISLLLEALSATPKPGDIHCVIGVRGPLAPPDMCNGLMIPVVGFDQIYWFDRESLVAGLTRKIQPGEKLAADQLAAAAEALFDRIMGMTDNAGSADEHRALNYLAVRDHRIYEVAAEAFRRNESLSHIAVRRSPLSGARKIVDVIFSFTNRNTDVVSKHSARVDVTDEFPFLVTKLSAYYDP